MNPLRAFPVLALLVLVGCWLAGCSTSYQKAGVHVALLSVDVADDNRAVLQVELQNENIVAVAFTSTKFKVSFNGVSYGEAIGTKPVALMEMGKVRQEAVLKLADAAAAARLKAALAAGPLSYALECRLLCEVGEEDIYFEATSRGEVAAR